jgi:hypothetical protein
VSARVCSSFSGASRLSRSLSGPYSRETAAWRAYVCVCVHKPDLLLPGSSNSRLISLAPCQSTACLPLRAPNFIWPAARARQFIAAEALNQARGDHCQK